LEIFFKNRTRLKERSSAGFGEVDGNLGPDLHPTSVATGRAVPELKGSPNGGRIEGGISACFQHLHAVHRSRLRDAYPKEGLAFYIGIPEPQGVLDGNVAVEGNRRLQLRRLPTPQERKKQARPDPTA
jgi:hypothetical protein